MNGDARTRVARASCAASPVVVAGGASGQMDGGRHKQYALHTPMSNLLLAVLDKLGIDHQAHGDSTGKLEI